MAGKHRLDWVIYAGALALVIGGSFLLREDMDAPSVAEPEGPLLGPITPFDPAVTVNAPETPFQPQAGTAFSIGSDGRWLTARHVVEGCRQPAVLVGEGQAVAVDVRLAPNADVAVLLSEGGSPGLPLALDHPLRSGQRGYHPGFPQGRAGEVTSRLLGRETLRVRGRGERDEPVLAWAEVGRSAHLEGALSGLSGAPVLDGQGQVVAITLAESPRRGRLYTTAPESLGPAIRGLQHPEGRGPGGLVSIEDYGRVSDRLRRTLRVAQVLCLSA